MVSFKIFRQNEPFAGGKHLIQIDSDDAVFFLLGRFYHFVGHAFNNERRCEILSAQRLWDSQRYGGGVVG